MKLIWNFYGNTTLARTALQVLMLALALNSAAAPPAEDCCGGRSGKAATGAGPQRTTLQGLEQFGWELKFVRRKPFQPPVAVVFDGDRMHFAVLELDGSLNEEPGFDIRQG